MPKFKYSAKNLEGDVITGVFSGMDESAVVSMLRAKDYFQLEIRQLLEEKEKRELELSRKIPLKDLSVFCTQFGAVLKAGVPIAQALEIMRSQTSNKKLVRIIDDVNERIQQGNTISEAFGVYADRLPRLFLSMIESGEVSGSLESTFQRMGETFTKEYKLGQKVKSVMIYPTILAIVAICVVIFLMVWIVPTFTGLYASSGNQLPFLTRVLLNISGFMANNILLLGMMVAFIIVSVGIYIRSEHGRMALDRAKATMPVVGKLLLTVYAARFTRSMSTLSSTGVSLPKAIEVTASNLSNRFAEKKLAGIIEEINKGRGLSAPLAELNLFPPMVIHMCRLGEESGTLDNLLEQAAEFYEAESETAMGRLASLVEPCVIIFMGGSVLLIVLSILLPMFGMYSMVV